MELLLMLRLLTTKHNWCRTTTTRQQAKGDEHPQVGAYGTGTIENNKQQVARVVQLQTAVQFGEWCHESWADRDSQCVDRDNHGGQDFVARVSAKGLDESWDGSGRS